MKTQSFIFISVKKFEVGLQILREVSEECAGSRDLVWEALGEGGEESLEKCVCVFGVFLQRESEL